MPENKSRPRSRPNKSNTLGLLADVFRSSTMIAVGIDPEKGLFHAMLKTKVGERKWSEPLSPGLMAVFSVMRSMIQ